MQAEPLLTRDIACRLSFKEILSYLVLSLVPGNAPAHFAQCNSTFQAISDSAYVWGAFDEDGNPDSTDV